MLVSGKIGIGGQRVTCYLMGPISPHLEVVLQPVMPELQAWGRSLLPWSAQSRLELVFLAAAGEGHASDKITSMDYYTLLLKKKTFVLLPF